MTELAMNTDEELRKVESELERIARSICSVKGSGETFRAIDQSLKSLRDAICGCWKIGADGL